MDGSFLSTKFLNIRAFFYPISFYSSMLKHASKSFECLQTLRVLFPKRNLLEILMYDTVLLRFSNSMFFFKFWDLFFSGYGRWIKEKRRGGYHMRSFFFFLPKDDTIWKVKVFGSFFVSLYMIEEKKQKIYVFFCGDEKLVISSGS